MTRYLLPILCLPCLAGAQTPARDVYLGLGVGDLSYELRANGVTIVDTSVAMLKVYGGFWLNPRWAFETSWQTTRSTGQSGLVAHFRELEAVGLTGTYTVTTATKVDVVTLRTLRALRYRWGSLFAGFGISGASVDSRIEVKNDEGAVGVTPRTSKNGFTVMTGAQWNFSAYSLRIEYEWWSEDMSAIEVGLHWRR